MRKIVIIIIIVILLITAAVFYFVYNRQSGIKDAATPGISKQENEETSPTEASLLQGVELNGKVLGLSRTQIAIAKEGGGVETLEIDGSTVVLEADTITKSGMGAVQVGKNIRVSFDGKTKKVIAITLLEK